MLQKFCQIGKHLPNLVTLVRDQYYKTKSTIINDSSNYDYIVMAIYETLR